MNLDIKKIKNAVHAFKACCSDDGLRVIELLHKYGTLNRNQINKHLGKTMSETYYMITQLTTTGIIVKKIIFPNVYYTLNNEMLEKIIETSITITTGMARHD